MRARRRLEWAVWWVTLVAATAVAVGVWMAQPAGAQTPAGGGMSPTRCADAASGGSGLDPGNPGAGSGGGMGGGGGGSWGGPTTTVSPAQALKDKDKEDEEHGLCATLLEDLAPGRDPGPYPSSHYDLGYDAGGSLSWWRKFSGWAMDFMFGISVWFTRIGIGIVNWAMGFELADALAPAAENVASAYKTQIAGPIDLGTSMLFICATWAMWLAFTGKVMRGAAELGVSLLIISVSAALWVNPTQSVMGALHFTKDFGNSIAGASTGTDPVDGEPVSADMASAVHKAMVEDPHRWLDWGPEVAGEGRCMDVYNAAVASGPWGAADEPRDAMKAAGCTRAANFNHDPTRERLLGALVITLGAAILMVLMVIVALTLLGVQLGALVVGAMSALALPLGALPGRMRSMFWRWIGAGAVLLVGVMVVTGLMAITLGGISAALAATGDLGLLRQMFVVDLIAGYALMKRGTIVRGARKGVQGFAQRMASSQPGSGRTQHHRVSWGDAGAGAAVGAAAMGAVRTGRSATRMVDQHQRRVARRQTRDYQREMRGHREAGHVRREGSWIDPTDVPREGNGQGRTDAERWQEWDDEGLHERGGAHVLDDALAP